MGFLCLGRRALAACALGTLLVVGVAVGASAASSGSSERGPSPAAQAAVGKCSTSMLSVWIEKPEGNGALGSRYFYVQFTNLSGRACTLRGAPGVSAVSLSGGRLGAPATLAAVHGPTQLLGNHATVSSLLKIAVPGVFPSCHPRLAAGLRIYPPNQRTSKVVPLPVETCPGSFMFVSEVQPSKQVEYP
jgi:hypothetical protein